MYTDLSERELDILLYIKRMIEINGYPPTVREICKGVNIKSTSTVHASLEKLELKNYIKRRATKTRAIEILDQEDGFLLSKKKTVDIPILGRVAAGAPLLAAENIEDTIPISVDQAQDRDLFFLEVKGESMINAGILDGDYVLIERRNFAREGQYVLALIDNEATIKTYYKEKDRVRLQPENDYMEPIYVKELEILGVVAGLYRNIL